MTTTSKLKEFSVAAARPLPVIVLADVSGSMQADGKIGALNDAMRDMLQIFAAEEPGAAEVQLALITFGGTATLHTALAPAKTVSWTPAVASGSTPFGAALALATNLVEDRAVIPSRAYTPTIVVASDGQPTDEWREPLRKLLSAERAKKATRLALAIGDDADEGVLREFLANPEARVLRAHEARDIRKFFRLVTMTVLARSRSVNPNAPAPLPSVEGFDD